MFSVAMMNNLHRALNWKSLALFVIGFGTSFTFLSYAIETLPMGTAYGIWTGTGASGGALFGMILYE
ncbi:SMR family transporter [Peribacillus simplex]|uniref:DMT family transporter n=1 Tax=Peribacillus simplex TaxID=1478 RepID=UPI00203FE293|nr:SMR family transporter [Peribacillus simplex]MCM3673286.1 SMR family transporter [Peribacillus simplex]